MFVAAVFVLNRANAVAISDVNILHVYVRSLESSVTLSEVCSSAEHTSVGTRQLQPFQEVLILPGENSRISKSASLQTFGRDLSLSQNDTYDSVRAGSPAAATPHVHRYGELESRCILGG